MCKRPVIELQRRQSAGIKMRRQCKVAIGSNLEKKRGGNFKPVVSRILDIGHEQPRSAAIIGWMGKARKRKDRQPEDFQPGILVTDAILGRVVDHPSGGDLPRWILWTTVRVLNRARAVDGTIKRADAIDTSAMLRSQTATVRQHDQQVFDHAILERLGQFDRIPIGDIPARTRHGHTSGGEDAARFAIP